MTTTTEITRQSVRDEIRRVLNVTRLHFANKFPILVLPLLILGFIFLVNLAIWWTIYNAAGPEGAAKASTGLQFSGASTFIFVYMLVVAVQAVNLTFPFALGYSVTRRDFYLGSAVTFVILSVYYASVMTIMASLERATSGWGLGGAMFDVVYFGAEDALQQFLLFLLLFLFFFFIGAATASVYVRWRANGMYVFWATLTLGLVGAVALITFTGNWPAVGGWFVANGAMGVALWSLLPTALAALVGFVLLRKATPKN